WSVFFLVPTGRGDAKYAVTPQEHEETFNKMYDLSRIMPYDIKSTEAPHYRRVFIQREVAVRRAAKGVRSSEKSSLDDAIGRAPMGLNDGKGFVFISHTGDVMPSGFLPLSGGNVRDQSVVDIYRDSPLFKEIRDYSLLKGKCGVCEFRNVCGGSRARTYALTGDYMESEPYCTYIPKKYGEEDSFRKENESATG
ncbi:MAG: radical SAM/SPASM domain-containing protein, partial [Candidatus Dadabacteria bacterium]|nr:radical SAM/SPASM domain-containing protein [Candidatus Dadabacteria bacterium]